MATPYSRGAFNPNPGGQGGPQNNYTGSFAGTEPTYATFDATTWGGRKEDVVFDPKTGQLVPVAGTSGEQEDVSRYQRLAQEPGQAPPRVAERDFFSRMAQDDGIRRLDDAASGRVSHGADLVRQQTRDAVSGLRSTAASVRGGPAARVAAARYSNREGAARTAIGNRQADAVRFGEMADARGAHMAAVTNQRDQDIGLASERARLEQDQRRRDAERESALERMAWETKNAGMGARLKRTAAQQGASANARGLAVKDAAREWEHTKDDAAMITGAVSGGTSGYAKSQTDEDDWDENDYSDERTKNIMYSPGEIKDAVQYPAFMEREEERRQIADPYKTEPDIGVGGAPRGYAAAREGQPGAMFGNAPQVQSGYEQPGAANAPGTSDWARYGEPAKHDGPVDWHLGGATTKKGKKSGGSGGFASLAKFLGGGSMRSDMTSKDEVMYSDDKTKLAAAYAAGKSAAAPQKKPSAPKKLSQEQKAQSIPGTPGRGLDASQTDDKGVITMAPVTVEGTPSKIQDTGPKPWDERAFEYAKAGNAAQYEKNVAAAEAWNKSVQDARDRAPNFAGDHYVPPYEHAQAIARADEATSDEKAKNVIDLDEDTNRATMRDGSSDPRTNSFDKTFRRDTKADQKRVKKSVEDKAGKDADAMMAGYAASMKKGPTARVEDLGNDAPDLSTAAKAREGQIPDDAMYRAMKSMQPSLYAYKPGFKPPEQVPGEVQAGPMANPMKKDPIAGLAVEQEPSTGLLAIDKDKALKLTMGSLAVLANDVEQLKRKKGAKK